MMRMAEWAEKLLFKSMGLEGGVLGETFIPEDAAETRDFLTRLRRNHSNIATKSTARRSRNQSWRNARSLVGGGV
jgi:hypothetical protein